MFNKIRKTLFIAVIIVFSAILFGCGSSKKLDPSTFDSYTNELFGLLIGQDELTINYLIQNRSDYGLEYYEPSLPKPSLNSATGLVAINLTFGRIKNYDYEQLNDDQKMTYNVLVDLVDKINAESSEMGYLDNNYLGSYLGYQAQLPLLLTEYHFYKEEDIISYLKFLEIVPSTFKAYYDFEVEKASKGYGMADFVIDKVVGQCENFISGIDNNTSFMYHVVNKKINECSFLTADKKQFYVERNSELLRTCMKFGYLYIKENLPTLKGKGKNDMGLAHYVGNSGNIGKEYYQLLFKDATGYDITCDDAIQYVDAKISQYVDELNRLSSKIKSSSSLSEQYQNLVSNEKFMTTSSPLEQLELYYELTQEDFPSLSVKPEIVVKYIDESMQKNFSPAAYMTSPIDNITTETIYLNPASIYLKDESGNLTDSLDTEYLYTTLAHEGLPGHLYQTAYFKSLDVNPIRKVLKNSGYVEGWATYAENYAYNFMLGKYDQAIIDYLQTEQLLVAAVYSRIDLGIHYNGWTVEELHSFMSNYFSIGDVSSVVAAYQQLVEIPTNYQQYFFTYLKINDIYDTVSSKLGSNFNVKNFHKSFLDCGPAPLRYVEDKLYSDYGIK